MNLKLPQILPKVIYLGDFLLLQFSFFFSYLIFFRLDETNTSKFYFLLVLSSVIWLFNSYLFRNFEAHRPLLLSNTINKFLGTLSSHLLILFIVLYFFRKTEYSRMQIVLTYLIFLVLFILWRFLLYAILDYIRKKGFNLKSILILGDENIANKLISVLDQHPEYGYKILDFVDDKYINDGFLNNFLGSINSFDKKIDEVFVCLKNLDRDLVKLIISHSSKNFINVKIVSDLIGLRHDSIELLNYDGIPVLNISSHPLTNFHIRLLKRLFDICFSLFVIILGAPIFLLVAIITKLTSKGPIFYVQERFGREGKPFKIIKFRSMYVDAEVGGPQLSYDNDPRVTPWGRFLRRFKIDELPQFFNVLKGDMSVVGPRPERQFFIERIVEKAPIYMKLLIVKPGITSIGQVRYGYAENVEQMIERMRYDLFYIDNYKPVLDFIIILQTLKVLIYSNKK